MDRLTKISQRIEELDPFSEERDAFATTILGGSVQLTFDGEGRILLPELLLSVASLTENAMFVGKGETFEIWEPKSFAEYASQARQKALNSRTRLRGDVTVNVSGK